MEKAAAEERQRKKRSLAPSSDAPDAKRMKLDPSSSGSAVALAGFDFTTLPANLVTELIVANLQAFTEPTLAGLVQAYRARGASAPADPPMAVAPPPAPPPANGHTIPTGPANHAPPTAPRAIRELSKSASVTPVPQMSQEKSKSRSRSPTPTPPKEEEPVDPLQMDIDDEELEYEPDKLNTEVRVTVSPPLKFY